MTGMTVSGPSCSRKGRHGIQGWAFVGVMLMMLLLNTVQAGDYQYRDGIFFEGVDNTRLAANVFVPDQASASNPAPVIIFINSWALEDHEYIAQAAKLANKGYVVFSYAGRGWGQSEGVVNAAGEKDVADVSRAIDWVVANTPADAARIGIGGISYGAGISLQAAGSDKRIRAVAAMSGWADIVEALYGGETPDLVWGGILLGSGYLTGNMDPEIARMFDNMLHRKDIDALRAWGAKRSPISRVKQINANKPAIYINNNFRDEVFEPNAMMDFYAALDVPKKLDLSLGNHATAELGGLAGLRNEVWSNVHDWFDHWLKGVDNGVTDEPPVSMALKLDHERDRFNDWPSDEVQMEAFHLGPRKLLKNGSLKAGVASEAGRDRIYSGVLSGVTAGMPVISSTIEQHLKAPVTAYMPLVNRALAVIYESHELSSPARIRGIPELTLSVTPSAESAQLVAYLYDLGPWGNAKLITHGPVSVHGATPGETVTVSLEMIATAYDVPAGHRLALAVDTADPQYAPPRLAPYRVAVELGGQNGSVLSVPMRR